MAVSHLALTPNDLDPLLAPISPDNPAGVMLRYSSLYDAITQARQADDPDVPRGIWEHKLKQADYGYIAEVAYKALCQESKDLQVMGWLMEAWIDLYGLEGLLRSLDTLERFLKEFWPVLYPKLEDLSDPSLRLAPLLWINEKIPTKIQATIPLIPLKSPGDEAVTLTKILAADDLERRLQQTKNPEEERQKLAREKIVFATAYTKMLAEAEAGAIEKLDAALQGAQKKLQDIEALLLIHLPDTKFHFSKWHKMFRVYSVALAPYITAVAPVGPVVTEADTASVAPALPPTLPDASVATTASKGEGVPLGQALTSRQEAYQQLAIIADFLMRVEPHSPAPYLIRKAIAWGTMDLQRLLIQIVQEGGDLAQYMQWLGIKPEEKPRG